MIYNLHFIPDLTSFMPKNIEIMSIASLLGNGKTIKVVADLDLYVLILKGVCSCLAQAKVV